MGGWVLIWPVFFPPSSFCLFLDVYVDVSWSGEGTSEELGSLAAQTGLGEAVASLLPVLFLSSLSLFTLSLTSGFSP